MRALFAGVLAIRPATLVTVCAGLFVAACASAPRTVLVDGREVPRPTLSYSGDPFSLRHHRAYPNPGSPSSGLVDAGGDIDGRVCGMNIDYEVRHKGDHVELSGHIDGPLPSELSVREDGRARTVEGRIGGLSVSVEVRSDGVTGQVGKRMFTLEPIRDDLRGFMRLEGTSDSMEVVVHGWRALGDMPAADQAALLPNLLTCGLPSTTTLATTLVLGIGGNGSDAAPQSSSLYSRGR